MQKVKPTGINQDEMQRAEVCNTRDELAGTSRLAWLSQSRAVKKKEKKRQTTTVGGRVVVEVRTTGVVPLELLTMSMTPHPRHAKYRSAPPTTTGIHQLNSSPTLAGP
jgi:hypothetical protein